MLSVSAFAQNVYYVNVGTGSDSNSGTSAGSAWKTINHANSAMTVPAAGVVVHVAAGTYPEDVSVNKSGTASGYIRYVCDTKWTITVGSSSCDVTGVSFNTIWNLPGASYVEINGFEIDGSGHDTGIGISGTSNTGVRIIGNKIHDTARQGNKTAGAVIALNADAQTVTVPGNNLYMGNYIYHNNGGGSSTQNAGGANHGIYVEESGDIIENNLIMDQGGGWCIQLWHQSTNVVITNNTLLNCARGGIIVGSDLRTGVPDDHTTVNNNIVANSGGNGGQYGIIEYGSSCTAVGPNNVYYNNLTWGNSRSDYSLCGGKTPVNPKTVSSCGGSVSACNSSVFVNYTGLSTGDYHLKSGSSAINAGTNDNCATGGISPCVPTTDFSGTTRPTPPAIAAFESRVAGSAPSAPSVLTALVR